MLHFLALDEVGDPEAGVDRRRRTPRSPSGGSARTRTRSDTLPVELVRFNDHAHLAQAYADVFLGVPFNIASYALLTMMVAQVCDLAPGDFVHTLGDAHLYSIISSRRREQLTREPRPLPTMR